MAASSSRGLGRNDAGAVPGCLTLSSMATTPDPRILTPSQLNTLARSLLEDAFPVVLVEGEICNLSRPASGHMYFTLKDARAQVRCALFKPKSQWLPFQPRDGLRVLARARLTLYEARGDYQLIVDSLEEAGEGALRRAVPLWFSKVEFRFLISSYEWAARHHGGEGAMYVRLARSRGDRP